MRFALGSAAAIAIAVVGGYFALRSVAIDEAKRETRTRVQEAGQLVESSIGDRVLTGRPADLGAVDDVVVGRVLSDSIVRVKIWSADGRVLYSDDPAQIGGRYALSRDQLRLLREGGAQVEVTDLDHPENALDRKQGRLIEAYTRIRTPSGATMVFESIPTLRLGHRKRAPPAGGARPADPGSHSPRRGCAMRSARPRPPPSGTVRRSSANWLSSTSPRRRYGSGLPRSGSSSSASTASGT